MSFNKKKQINIQSLKEKIKLFFKKNFAEKDYFQNQILVWLLILSLAGNLANWIILLIFIRPVDFPIILHYNVYFGVDSTGDWKQVYFLPAIGFLLLIINWIFAVYFYKSKERIASYILLIALLMAIFSLLIASISVIIINY